MLKGLWQAVDEAAGQAYEDHTGRAWARASAAEHHDWWQRVQCAAATLATTVLAP